MLERMPNVNPDLYHASRLSFTLIAEISDSNREIGRLKHVLSAQEYSFEGTFSLKSEIRALRSKVNADLVSLLTLRQGNALEEDIKVDVDTFPEEILHPFSTNFVKIDVPSPLYPDSAYSIHASLRDLRGSGVKDSIQAEELIGEKTTKIETPTQHLIHTKDELLIIKETIGNVRNGTADPSYTREYLDVLTKHLIVDRIIPLVCDFQIPPEEASVRFNRLRDPNGKHYELTVITIYGHRYYIKTPDAFLKKTIKEKLGGYDFAMP